MGAIFKHSWALYRQNFFLLTGVMLVVWIPCELFISWMDYNVFGPDDFRHTFNLYRMVDNFLGIIAISGMFYVLRERGENRPVSLGSALGAGFGFWGRLFFTRLIIGIGILIGLLLLIVPGIYLYIRLILCEALVVAEEVSGMENARRSHALTKGKFWSVLGWSLGGSLPPVILAIVISVLPAFVPFLDNWVADGICGIISDIPMVFIYPLIWAIYLHLLAEESSHKEAAEIAASLPQ